MPSWGGERQDDSVGNVGWIRQERAQEPNRTELKGKAKACMVVTPRFQQRAISVIEMKGEGELFWRWLPHRAAITASLLGRQKRNGHGYVLPFHRVSQKSCTCASISAKIAE